MQLTGREIIHSESKLTIRDFWSWAYSNILDNRNRAVFAEFLVAAALGTAHTGRVEWDQVDTRYRDRAIEVKASAYKQSWPQKTLSRICFGIGEKHGWDARTNTFAPSPLRSADLYIFCLFPETEFAPELIFDTQRWHFYVLRTEDIRREFGSQKSVSLGRLNGLTGWVSYDQLRAKVDDLLGD